MKLFTVLFLFIIVMTGIIMQPGPAHAEESISIYIDDLPVLFDTEPLIQRGRTLVPFRPLTEALNINVSWCGQTQTVTAKADNTNIKLEIGHKNAYVNQDPVQLEVPPQIVNGRTMIPLRFFSTAFGCKVDWDGSKREINIVSPPVAMPVIGFYALGDSRTSSWTNLFGVPYPETTQGNTDVIDEVALGWYSIDSDGYLLTRSKTGWQKPDGWEKVLAAAKQYNLDTEMVVHVTDGDHTISSLLASEEAVQRAAKEINQMAGSYGGVNLNFEGLGLSQRGEELTKVREEFNRFVKLLSQKLGNDKSLTLTIHPPNSEYQGYDYGTLAELADRIVVMAYDYGPRPEPLNLVLEAVKLAKKDVPPEKLFLGISVPYETPQSIVSKIGIAKRHNLGGIALWRLGLIPGQIWDVLRQMLETHSTNRNA